MNTWTLPHAIQISTKGEEEEVEGIIMAIITIHLQLPAVPILLIQIELEKMIKSHTTIHQLLTLVSHLDHQ